MKKERIGLIVAVLLIVWLSAALVRVENQRYALMVGMCRDNLGLTDMKCLASVQKRALPGIGTWSMR